jgi:hypothetical protein
LSPDGSHITVNVYALGVQNGARWLLSTVYHEGVHVDQFVSGTAATDADEIGSHLNEVEAYDKELAQSNRLGLSQQEIKSTLASREREFNQLDTAYRNQVAHGNYRPRAPMSAFHP